LKVDRSFTNLIEGPGQVPPLIEGLVFLGRQLGLEVVAEGIEITEQRSQLHRLGCLLGQGFLWSPPVDENAVEGILRRGEPEPVTPRTVPSAPLASGTRR